MSVLLIGIPAEFMAAIVRELTGKGDQVRILELRSGDAATVENLSVHVARGPVFDEDLVERAAQSVRSIVAGPLPPAELRPVVSGALAAGVDRFVTIAPQTDPRVLELLRAAGVGYVSLSTGRRRLLARRLPVEPERVALAVDAADDLAGDPHLELDLTDEASWLQLRLQPDV